MEQGEYNHRRNTLVTNDVKEVSSVYTDIIKARELSDNVYSLSLEYDIPSIEIWVKDKYVTYFNEKEENVNTLTKFLSKLARGL